MKRAGEIISALFKENFGSEFMEKARSNASLFSSWADIVTEAWRVKGRGFPYQNIADDSKNHEIEDVPAAAAHSWIMDFRNNMLLVEADHPGWIQILKTKQKELLLAANRRYPELGIKSISFRLSREKQTH